MCEGTSLAATQLATSLHANRPGRTRTCSPRFWSPLLATPALHRLLIFNDLALGEQRRRCWTTPALALSLALRTIWPDPGGVTVQGGCGRGSAAPACY